MISRAQFPPSSPPVRRMTVLQGRENRMLKRKHDVTNHAAKVLRGSSRPPAYPLLNAMKLNGRRRRARGKDLKSAEVVR